MLSGSRAAAMNDYFAAEDDTHDLPIKGMARFADKQPFDPIETYLEMRDEPILSFEHPSPLAKLEPRTIGGLILLAARTPQSSLLEVVKADILTLDDLARKSAALTALIHTGMEAYDASQEGLSSEIEEVLGNLSALARLDMPRASFQQEVDKLDKETCRQIWRLLSDWPASALHPNNALYIALWKQAAYQPDDSSQLSSFVASMNTLLSLVDRAGSAEGLAELTDYVLDQLQKTSCFNQLDRLTISTGTHDRQLLPHQQYIVCIYRAFAVTFTNSQQWEQALTSLSGLLRLSRAWTFSSQKSNIPIQWRILSSIVATNDVDLLGSLAMFLTPSPMKENLLASQRLQNLFRSYLAIVMSDVCEWFKGRSYALDLLEKFAPNFEHNRLMEMHPLFGSAALIQILQYLNLARKAQLPVETRFSRAAHQKLYRKLGLYLIGRSQSAGNRMKLDWQNRLLDIVAGSTKTIKPANILRLHKTLKQLHADRKQTFRISPRTMANLARAAVQRRMSLAFRRRLISDYISTRPQLRHPRDPNHFLGGADLSHEDLTSLTSACHVLGLEKETGLLFREMLHRRMIPNEEDVQTTLALFRDFDPVLFHTVFESLRKAGFRPHDAKKSTLYQTRLRTNSEKTPAVQ